MAETKKITMAAIVKATNKLNERNAVETYGEGENAVEITVKTRLTMSERITFVNDVVDTLFVADKKTGSIIYVPSLRDFAFGHALVRYFTNVSLSGSAGKIFAFLEETQLVVWLTNIIGEEYVAKMAAYTDEAIEYRKQREMKTSKLDGLLESILSVVKAVGDETKDIDVAQIVNYVQQNAPEFADTVKKMIDEQATSVVA